MLLGYVAVGFSLDHKMGDDVIVACLYDGKDVDLLMGFNKGKENSLYST